MAEKPTTIKQFFERFPDDDACLEHIMRVRFGLVGKCPKCQRQTKYYRIAKRRAYECTWCGHHLYPCVGTPFESSRTKLQSWFFAMFLFCTTRNGVSAKELQRALGITYKAAWRMGTVIRRYMGQVDGDGMLGGSGAVVEADKAFIGGKDKRGKDDKAVVLGIVERGGEVITRVIEDRQEATVIPHIVQNVRVGSRVATDEAKAFLAISAHGYRHSTVNHAAKEYVRGDTHTNTIEGFWAMVKRTIRGTHIWVSPKYLPLYLREIEYRFNLRRSPSVMFDLLVQAFGSSPRRVG